MPEPENKSNTLSKSNCEATAHISVRSLFFDPINLVVGYCMACNGNGEGTTRQLNLGFGGMVTITSSPVRPLPLLDIYRFVWTT